jgi:hypothetical protein
MHLLPQVLILKLQGQLLVPPLAEPRQLLKWVPSLLRQLWQLQRPQVGQIYLRCIANAHHHWLAYSHLFCYRPHQEAAQQSDTAQLGDSRK